MFFMMGITNGRRDLDFNQTVICDRCGKYGRLSVFVTYTVLSLFFIPVLKWGKQYYVQTSCCKTVYQLNPEIGKRIERGEKVELHARDMKIVSGQSYQKIRRCGNCGYTTEEEFEYCPKCGTRFMGTKAEGVDHEME